MLQAEKLKALRRMREASAAASAEARRATAAVAKGTVRPPARAQVLPPAPARRAILVRYSVPRMLGHRWVLGDLTRVTLRSVACVNTAGC